MTTGRRIMDTTLDPALYESGDYGLWQPAVEGASLMWVCKTPNGHSGNLSKHDVTVHEDGTITVSPSILVTRPPQEEMWHGYLERGVWREC